MRHFTSKEKKCADACVGGNSAGDAVVSAWMLAAAEAAAAAAAAKYERVKEGEPRTEADTRRNVATSSPSLTQQLREYRAACSAAKGSEDSLAEAWRARGARVAAGKQGRRRRQRSRLPLSSPAPILVLDWSDAVDAAADAVAEQAVRDVAHEVGEVVGALVDSSWRAEMMG